jgi:NitT/TauT family transport system substrate-binding protein
LLLLLACSSSPEPAPAEGPPPAAAPTPVRLALNWFPEPEFGGFYHGVLDGQYAAAGFAVEIVPGGPGVPTLELLATGQAQAAITAADDLLVKRQRGVRAVAVWAGFQDSPLGLMVHRAAGVADYAGLLAQAGRTLPATPRVAIEIGGPFQQFLWKRFSWEGRVEAVPYSGAVAAFVADPQTVQQAYVTSEPCVASGLGADPLFLPASAAGWNPYGTVLALPEPLPDWAPAFVLATQAAWQAYLSAPGRANAEIARQNPELPPDRLDCITAAQAPFVQGGDGLGQMREARWEATAAALVDLGMLPAGSTARGAWVAPALDVPPGTPADSPPAPG